MGLLGSSVLPMMDEKKEYFQSEEEEGDVMS